MGAFNKITAGIDDLIEDMEDIMNLPEAVLLDMLNAEADIVVKAQKDSIRREGLVDTGQLMESIGRSNKLKSNGLEKYMEVYPQGTRKDGIRNTDVAFINEFGAPKKHIKASRWMQKANERCADEAVQKAAEAYDRFLKANNL